MKERLHFPGVEQFISNQFSPEKPSSLQFAEIFETSINLIEMSLQLFIVCTIRCYEDVIIDEPDNYKKKVKYLKDIIRERFRAPSLGTLLDLVRHCFYLINDEDECSPNKLLYMKNCLKKSITLGPIGVMFQDIETILDKVKEPDKVPSTKTIYGPHQKQQVLTRLLPKFVEYRNHFKHSRELSLILEEHLDSLKLNLKNWQLSLNCLLETLSPILSNIFIQKTLGKVQRNYKGLVENRKENIQFIINVKTFIDGRIETSEEEISYQEYQDLDEYQGHDTDLLIMKKQGKPIGINVFPFLVIRDDKLFFYKRTKAKGYEYYSLSGNLIITVATKRKFNHSLFKVGITGDQQSLFWTEVLPIDNPENHIRANIPTEGMVDFIGRKKQIKRVIEEVIEIPNQNGIIYGPGGVGKTALMIQLSKQLFEELVHEDVYFKNIIWVTAKENYFNPELCKIEEKDKQFESLETVLSVILRFFNYENIAEYDFADKIKLVIELLEENSVLLILDNFETITKGEADKILEFFGLEVKKHLRKKPDFFKLIVTAREQIPCGFHQISLEGLDLRESKQLMKKLFEQYKRTKSELSDEQKKELHDVTHGIPILIKHCFGQIYEYNKPFESVLHALSKPSSEVIRFSFSEIISLTKKDEQQLEVLVLLELHGQPLSIRQLGNIIDVDTFVLGNKIPSLVNFQCIERINQGVEEKYFINEKVQLFTKGLVKENFELAERLRKKLIRKLSLEKQMEYTIDEEEIISLFKNYVSEQRYLEAEEFIQNQLDKNTKSILLKYHYAKYLKEEKQDIDGALNILDKIVTTGYKHANIYRLLISCFISRDIPNYSGARKYVSHLQEIAIDDDNVKLEIAEFYIRWSTSIKISGRQLDPIKEIERTAKYKELANDGIKILKKIDRDNKTAKYYYLAAQANFNIWKNDTAQQMVNKALSLVGENSGDNHAFMRLKRAILRKMKPSMNLRRF